MNGHFGNLFPGGGYEQNVLPSWAKLDWPGGVVRDDQKYLAVIQGGPWSHAFGAMPAGMEFAKKGLILMLLAWGLFALVGIDWKRVMKNPRRRRRSRR